MKRVILISISFLVLLPFLSKTCLLIWFKANQNVIANTLCVNKENEKRKDCRGCCYLDEQLSKVEDSSSNTNPVKSNENKRVQTETNFEFNLSPFQFTPNLHRFYTVLHSGFMALGLDTYVCDISKPPSLTRL